MTNSSDVEQPNHAVYSGDDEFASFRGTEEECKEWVENQGLGSQIRIVNDPAPLKTFRIFYSAVERMTGQYDVQAVSKEEAEHMADPFQVEEHYGWGEHWPLDRDDCTLDAIKEVDSATDEIIPDASDKQ